MGCDPADGCWLDQLASMVMYQSLADVMVGSWQSVMVMVLMAGPAKWDGSRMMEDRKLRSESIFRDERRYFLDLKENHRGRFLRVNITYLLC